MILNSLYLRNEISLLKYLSALSIRTLYGVRTFWVAIHIAWIFFGSVAGCGPAPGSWTASN